MTIPDANESNYNLKSNIQLERTEKVVKLEAKWRPASRCMAKNAIEKEGERTQITMETSHKRSSTLNLLKSSPEATPQCIPKLRLANPTVPLSDALKIATVCPTSTHNPATALSQDRKRQMESPDQLIERDQKRHNHGVKSEETVVHKTVTKGALPAGPDPETVGEILDQESLSVRIIRTEFPLPTELTADPRLIGRHEEMVLEPKRVQKLLRNINIAWDLDVVSRILHMDYVFPHLNLLRVWLPLRDNVKLIKASADILFLSSLPEDAFPLFLLVWLAHRYEPGCKGTTALIQCARSAIQEDDRVLVGSILRGKLTTLSSRLPELELTYSLVCLEISQLSYTHGYHKSGTFFLTEARTMCPSKGSFRKIFSDTHRQMNNYLASDAMSQDILEQAFELAELSKSDRLRYRQEEIRSDKYTMRDVMLAVISLAHYQAQVVVISATKHLRGILRHAVRLLRRPEWRDSIRNWQKRLQKHWPGSSKNAERAVYFDMLVNWQTAQDCMSEDLSIQTENPLIGISTLEILSVVSALVWEENNTQDGGEPCLDWGIGLRAAALLTLPNDKLLFQFLWCSVQRSRRMEFEDVFSTASRHSYRSLVNEVFKKCSVERKIELVKTKYDPTIAELDDLNIAEMNDPTMAESLDTSSTLSSMRTHAKMAHLSSRAPPSDAESDDELEDISIRVQYADEFEFCSSVFCPMLKCEMHYNQEIEMESMPIYSWNVVEKNMNDLEHQTNPHSEQTPSSPTKHDTTSIAEVRGIQEIEQRAEWHQPRDGL